MSSLAARLWSKVVKWPGDGCWEWTGAKRSEGYGVIWRDRRNECAHRVSYELTFGPIPPGLLIRHKCDNPGCVRPDHLIVGTQKENIQDAALRQRQAVGERVGTATNTTSVVLEIRRALLSGTPGAEVARMFGVSPQVVSSIKTGRAWKHLGGAIS